VTPAVLGETPFDALGSDDLRVDHVYRGGRRGNAADDPIQRLVPVGNQGGFRYRGSIAANGLRIVVLYTTGDDPQWPDHLDPFTGAFTYYGDNKRPGHNLHDTHRRGNEILRSLFDHAHGDVTTRGRVPPILVFSKVGTRRDVMFRGLAVPGSSALPAGDDLVAVWRVFDDRRFQNYKATFTILDVPVVTRAWLSQVVSGDEPADAPSAWATWVETGVVTPLVSARIDIRTPAMQVPPDVEGRQMLKSIHAYFNHVVDDPSRFEACAVEIWRRMAPETGEVDLTRPWRDGGRDATGNYMLGPTADRLPVEFALEAKCYADSNGVGVRDMSRLISRLRHRQFGVFVTTSYFNAQVYEEVRADGHPVILICGRDIVETLRATGIATTQTTEAWLHHEFPGPNA
jgi:hypothetical protein